MTNKPNPDQFWTLETLVKWAEEKIPDDFRALPPLSRDALRSLNDESTRINKKGNATSWSKGTVPGILNVGTVEGTEGYFTVFAYVHGFDRNQIGYVLKTRKNTFYPFDAKYVMLADLEEPFCWVEEKAFRCSVAETRALLLFYFLNSCVIDKFKGYATFLKDFEEACSKVRAAGLSCHLPVLLDAAKQNKRGSGATRTMKARARMAMMSPRFLLDS